MPPKESVIEKITKLLSLAVNNPNPAEAEAAMAKAKVLMLKHAVDESKLRGKDEPHKVEVIKINIGRRFESWMKTVQSAVALMYDARIVVSRGYAEDTAIFVCADYDAPLLHETYNLVIRTILREAARITRGRAMADSFRSGASLGFYTAVQSANQQVPTDKQTTAIVLQRSELVKAEYDKLFPKVKSVPNKVRASDVDAFNSGYGFGSTLNTGKANKKIE